MNTISFGYYGSVITTPAYEILAQSDSGGGYDWSTEAILRRLDDGALFYASDSGCSCNYWGGDEPHTMEPIDSVDEGLRKASSSTAREALQRSLDRNGDSEEDEGYQW